MRAALHTVTGFLAVVTLAVRCGGDGPTRARPVPRSVTWTAPKTATPVTPTSRPGAARPLPMTTQPRPMSSPAARPAATAPRPRPVVDRSNRQRPAAVDPDLTRQGRTLFAAIVKDDPALARGFFFPRKPFTPLKKAGNPDRYWQHIHGLYERDIRRLRRRRRDWTGATFESLRPGTPPVWIEPGRVHNRIGYYRTRFARLRYRFGGKRYTLFLHTLISWQGQWYVTHLLPAPRRRSNGRSPTAPR